MSVETHNILANGPMYAENAFFEQVSERIVEIP